MKIIAYLMILSFLLTFSIFSADVFATSFTASVTPTTVNATTSVELTFNITNLNATYNITQTNITLPYGFSFKSSNPGSIPSGQVIIFNYNITPSSSSTYIITVDINVTGNYGFSISVLDGAGSTQTNTTNNITINDVTAPTYTLISPIPASGTKYSPNVTYYFNITWNDNVELDTVWFNWNNSPVNETITAYQPGKYSVVKTDLPAGNYTYQWYANDTSGRINTTGPLNYTVALADNLISLTLNNITNQNITVVKGTSLMVTGCGIGNLTIITNLTGRSDTISNLSCNFTQTYNPDFGYYFITLNASGNENYTANSSTYFVMVVPNYTVSTSIPSTYSPTTQATFRINFTSPPEFSLLIEGNWYNVTNRYSMTNVSNTTFSYSIILPAGNFYWQIYGNYSGYIFNLTPTNSFTVSKATPTLSLVASPSWSVAKGTQTSVLCSSDQVSVNLYRNDTAVSNPDTQTLDAGVYVYKCNNTETANYSSTNVTNTLIVRVYTIDLAFTKAENLILVRQGSSNSTIVEVKNTGELSQNISFTIENINSTWYSINATNASLASGKTASFRVNFFVGDVEIKDYTGMFKAYSPNKTITSNFILRVLPSRENEIIINSTLATYKEEMITLEKEINQTKVQGLNVSLAEEKLNQLKAKIEQGKNYIANGDYFNAYLILKEIETSINDTRSELNKVKKAAEEARTRTRIIYISVGVCIAAVAALVYLFWPTESIPKPEVSKEDIWFKLKKKWEELRKKRYRYKG